MSTAGKDKVKGGQPPHACRVASSKGATVVIIPKITPLAGPTPPPPCVTVDVHYSCILYHTYHLELTSYLYETPNTMSDDPMADFLAREKAALG